MFFSRRKGEWGASLIDSIVGVALMSLIFVGIAGVFKMAIELVSNNKARIGALSLAQEQMEYIRSLSYDAVGTQGGIPPGAIDPLEQKNLNGVSYTRRTLVRYMDDPKDGLGALDTNAITADSKEVKVEISWSTRNSFRTTALVSRISPIGVEQVVPGGTLALQVVNALGTPVSGARVGVVNSSTSVNTEAYSDVEGNAIFIGAPSGTGYEISVTKSGHSSAYTYVASTTNPSPSPGHLTVSNNQTTSYTFAIDLLATHMVQTLEAIQTRTWSDTFSDATKISLLSTTTVSGGSVVLEGGAGSFEPEGEARGVPVSMTYLAAWKEARFSDTTPPGTSVRYFIFADGSGDTLVSDAMVPGNSSGFTSSPIDLSGISTTTHQTIRLGALLSSGDPDETPEIDSWEVDYDQGPVPLPNFDFSMRGSKTIGSNGGLPVWAYDMTHTTDAGGFKELLNLAWDAYLVSVDGTATGFDISESCEPQPRTVSPGSSIITTLLLVPHTSHSILVDVKSNTGTLIAGASVRLYRGVYDTTQDTSSCGQTFFGGLSSGTVGGGNPYSLFVSAPGYQSYSANDIDISGQSRTSVILSP